MAKIDIVEQERLVIERLPAPILSQTKPLDVFN